MTPNEQTITELLRKTAGALMARPETLEVSCAEIGPVLRVEFRCPREDYPRLVGGQGRTVGAIKVVLHAAARRMGRRMEAKLIEPDRGQAAPQQPFKERVWDSLPLRLLLEEITGACTSPGGKCRIDIINAGSFHAVKVEPTPWRGDPAACWNTGELGMALQTIVRAIGMNQGRIIHLEAYEPLR